ITKRSRSRHSLIASVVASTGSGKCANGAVRSDDTNDVISRIHDKQLSIAIQSYSLRVVQRREESGTAIASQPCNAVARNDSKASVRSQIHYLVVLRIRDVDPALLVSGDAIDELQRSIKTSDRTAWE